MRVETLPDGSKHYHADPDEHVVMTGPVYGLLQLSDGTQVNVTDPYVAVASKEQADDLAHTIAMVHVENGHPEDIDILTDPDTGQAVPVQRPFVYQAPDGEVHTGVGTPIGEHPLDYQLGEHDDEAAAAGTEAYRAMKADQAEASADPAASTDTKES
jgi:hypothetical protein